MTSALSSLQLLMLKTSSRIKNYVTSGPHLWVAILLHLRGPLSTKAIWSQYLKDQEVEEGLIRSKSQLKNQILHLMHQQKKIIRAPAQDVPAFKRSGWRVYKFRAFKNVDPQILAKLDPIPHLERQDLKQYCQQNNIEYYSKGQLKKKAKEDWREFRKYQETYINKKEKKK